MACDLQPSRQKHWLTALAALLLGGSILTVASPGFAQVQFDPPPVGAPGNREAGAARGIGDACTATPKELGVTALLPKTNLGLTTQANPSFFAYVPANNAQWLEFRLLDEVSGKDLYVAKVQMPEAETGDNLYKYKSAVLNFTLPNLSQTSLEVGKRYVWALMLVCDGDDRAADIVVIGVVWRVGAAYFQQINPAVKRRLEQLNTASALEQLSTYGAAGLWHDLLAETATLADREPAIYDKIWRSLLTSQQLAKTAAIPRFRASVETIEP